MELQLVLFLSCDLLNFTLRKFAFPDSDNMIASMLYDAENWHFPNYFLVLELVV